MCPSKAAELHQQVGEGYVEALIQPALASAIRNQLGRLDVEQLYVQRGDTLYQTPWGVVDVLERDLFERSKAEVEVGFRYLELLDANRYFQYLLMSIVPRSVQ